MTWQNRGPSSLLAAKHILVLLPLISLMMRLYKEPVPKLKFWDRL
jgi:hypothetical protein